MAQLDVLKEVLGNPNVSDTLLNFYLDNASDIICDLRNSDTVETKYLTTQVKIAVELFNKNGVEGQVSHTESGMARSYEKGDISESLISKITPIAKTPYSEVRSIT
jgi:hypothetical protein